MSRPISESLSLLSETLGNCKTNLKEKEVADVDNIKISDVDEKIAEIKSGGGGEGFHCIKDFINQGYEQLNDSYFNTIFNPEGGDIDVDIKFTVAQDNVTILTYTNSSTLTCSITLNNSFNEMTINDEVTIKGTLKKGEYLIITAGVIDGSTTYKTPDVYYIYYI